MPNAPVPDLAALADSVDALLAPAPAATEIVAPRDGPVCRLGLALDGTPETLAWARREALDTLLLHRHWSREGRPWPAALGILGNHDALDRRFSFATAPELHDALALRDVRPLGERDGWPLAVVGATALGTADAARDVLVELFGGIEAELTGRALDPDTPGETRIVAARAMTAALVEQAAAAGATLYVTGQLRAPGRAAVEATGMRVTAVGHRRSESWAIRRLGALLGARWPALDVRVADV